MARFVILALMSLFWMNNAAAYNCFQTSPHLSLLGDKYWENDNPVEVDGDEAELNWLKDLKGDWQGRVVEIDCKGTDAKPRRIVSQGEAKVKLYQRDDSLLVLQMEKDFAEQKVIKTERLNLLVKGNLQALSSPEALQIKAVERYRQKLRETDASRFVEIISETKLVDEQLIIEWSLFSNGVYAFTQTLTLTKQ